MPRGYAIDGERRVGVSVSIPLDIFKEIDDESRQSGTSFSQQLALWLRHKKQLLRQLERQAEEIQALKGGAATEEQ